MLCLKKKEKENVYRYVPVVTVYCKKWIIELHAINQYLKI